MDALAKLGVNWASLLAQLVNFSLLFVILYVFAYKPVLKMLDERSKKVADSLKQTENVKEQVARAEEESKKQIEAASREAQEILTRAMGNGEEVRRQAQVDAQKDAESLINRARAEIQQERDSAVSELRQEFADLTILTAEKVIQKSLDKNTHRDLIDKTLEESVAFKKQ